MYFSQYFDRIVVHEQVLSPALQSSIAMFMHEVYHALGVEHTQNRPDRDDYITIGVSGTDIEAVKMSQFTKCANCNSYGTKYDCDSIMHYSELAFALPGKKSMVAKPLPLPLGIPNFAGGACNLANYNSHITATDIELMDKIYGCGSGTTVYLRVKDILGGIHCDLSYSNPGTFTSLSIPNTIHFKDLTSLPYAVNKMYYIKFGGFQVPSGTDFEACIDSNTEDYFLGGAHNGLLKFAGITAPTAGTALFGPGTTIWVEVISQCQNTGECDEGFGHWWRFEKVITGPEAFLFANTHTSFILADGMVAGTPVELQYMGKTPCDKDKLYGCHREFHNK